MTSLFVRWLLVLVVFCGAELAQAGLPAMTPPAGWKQQLQGDGTMMFTPPGGVSCLLFVTPTQAAVGDFDQQFSANFRDLEGGLKLSGGAVLQQESANSNAGPTRLRTVAYGSGNARSVLMLLAQSSSRGVDFVVFFAPDTAAFSANALKAAELFQSIGLLGAPVGGRPVAPPAGSASPFSSGSVTTGSTATAGSSSAVLQYRLPAGWSQSQRDGVTVLISGKTYSGKLNQLEVLPARALQGDLATAFQGVWRELMANRFGTPFHPLPLRQRLPSGSVVAFDFDVDFRRLAGNDTVSAGLYLFSDGRAVIPVVAMLRDLGSVESELRGWLASAGLNSGARAPALYRLADVTGTWQTSDATMAKYVDSSGHYMGDASIASGETLTISAQGHCESQFAAIGGGVGRIRSRNAGVCSVEDDSIVLPSSNGPRRYRITGVGSSADGKRRFMLLSITRDDYPFPQASSMGVRAGSLYVSAP